MLKMALFDWRSMKTALWIKLEDGAFALSFRPHRGALGSSSVPAPGNLPSKTKKKLMPGGRRMGAVGFDWCIKWRACSRAVPVFVVLRDGCIVIIIRQTCEPETNRRKSICVSRPLSMKQETKIMHICSVKTWNPPEHNLPARVKIHCSILARGRSSLLPTDPLFAHCRQDRQYVFPLNIIYNTLSYLACYWLGGIKAMALRSRGFLRGSL